MKELGDHIDVELIELYALGITTPEETTLVEQWVAQYPEVRQELAVLSEGVELLAKSVATPPPPVAKPFLLGTIEYMERLKKGEAPSFPPQLIATSTKADYQEWLDRVDLQPPSDADNMYISLIGATPELTTAIVWVKEELYPEEHNDQLERFLVIEGSCDMYVGDKVYPLKAGDVFTIPLHSNHHAMVTSGIPCKLIVQRIAA